ncbi:MAG: His/Gly/Thr/Pro-type tRNA ligase C-terminal domain-containing protein [Mollicutes bacterium UO1]
MLIGENEELVNYYQGIYQALTPHYRCQLYNSNKQFNLNILQADKEGCPFKIILGKNELEKKEITLVRRDNVERKIVINLEVNEIEQKFLSASEKYMEDLGESSNGEIKKEKNEPTDSFKKGMMAGKIFKVITKEIEELKKSLYQKSTNFRDKHIFSVASFSELEAKTKEGAKGLFLVPFCNNLECEKNIKKKVPAYSIRCIALGEKIVEPQRCFSCQLTAVNIICLGRSY